MAQPTAIFSDKNRIFRRLRQFLKDLLPEFVLLLIVAFLAFTNVAPNTWLIGWDNLLPEFNFSQDLRRNLFGVWAEYRGTGLLSGQAYMADLPRELLLWALNSLGIAVHSLRYLWTFAMLYLGAVGAARLFRHLLKSKYDQTTRDLAAFLTGLFYIFNLSTLQLFFVPFDSFVTFYGALPWFVFALLKLIFTKPNLKTILFFFLVNLLIAPSFVIYTLTIPLALYLLPFVVEKIKRSLLPLAISFSAQAFWLLPIVFFVFSGRAGALSEARINAISSPETLDRNLAFSGLNFVLQLKGYLFENLDLMGDKYAPLMGIWRDHLDQPTIIAAQGLIILVTVLGFIFSFRGKLKHERSLATATLLTIFFMVGSGIPLLNRLPLLSEALRSPFTKFSYTLALSYSLYFAFGSLLIMDLFSFLHYRFTYFLTTFSLGIVFVLFMTPAFTGNLIAPSMRLAFPPEYSELFSFFQKEDPATRIANFPQYTFWGWNYYNWGYRGAGFLWYGFPQPLMDRAFDVWEKTNEKYYEEISAALMSENQKDFDAVIDKYAINWLLIDKNVITPSSNIDSGLKYLQKFLDNSDKVTLAKNIDDKIFIYKTNLSASIKHFLSVKTPSSQYNHWTSLSLRPTSIKLAGNQILFPVRLNSGTLTLPSYADTEKLIPTTISYRKTPTGIQLKLEPILPQVIADGKNILSATPPSLVDFPLENSASGLVLGIDSNYIEIQLPDELSDQLTFYEITKLYLPVDQFINLALYSGSPIYRLELTSALAIATPYQCYTNKPNRKIEKIVDRQTISLIGTDLVGCLSAPLPAANSLNQLLSLEFTYSSNTDTPGSAAITDISLGGEQGPQPLIARKIPTLARTFVKARLVPLQANLVLEASETKSPQEVDYQNITVSYLPQLGESNLYLSANPTTTVSLIKESDILVILPLVDAQYTVSSNKNNNLLSTEPRNCDNFNQGQVDRQITSEGFLYTATSANACDQMNLKHLPHGINYALITNIQNEAGLFPTVCLENYSTRRCDVYERLIGGPQVLLQPIANPNEPPGYTLHLNNESFGNQQTRNLIRSITITPLPLKFLKNISFTPANSELARAQIGSELAFSSTHPNEFLYTITTTNNQPTNLNLYQTRSPFWVALEVSEVDLKLPLWLLIAKLPYLYFFGNKSNLLPHDDTNLWHNSWTLPSGTHHLVIYYLPQYLEFLGFLLLPLPLITAIIWYLAKRRSTKKSPR